MRRFAAGALKALISLVAIMNMIWFLAFDYKNPRELIAGVSIEYETESTGSENVSGAILSVPSDSMKYNGNGKFDPLKDAHVVDENGVLIDGAKITYSITGKYGGNIREKVIEYEAHIGEETLYGKRNLSLGIDYSGPSVFAKKALPYCRTGEADSYADKIRSGDFIEASDGFGKNILNSVEVELKRFDRGDETAIMTVTATNEFGDSASADCRVPMNDTGVVLTLLNSRAAVPSGSSFRVKDYVDECYFETPENSLLDNIRYEGEVNTDVPGRYEITVYTSGPDGISSIGRKLEVIVTGQEDEDEDENG